jgi:hypothetical protein
MPNPTTDNAGRVAWSRELRTEIEQWMRRHGPANCWTADTGTAAKYLFWLLQVIDEYERRLSEVSPVEGPEDHAARIRAAVDA